MLIPGRVYIFTPHIFHQNRFSQFLKVIILEFILKIQREGEWRAIESRLKMELEQINSQMRRLTREIEELKRQNKVLDITKGELESQIMTFKKENESHQRHIEAVGRICFYKLSMRNYS